MLVLIAGTDPREMLTMTACVQECGHIPVSTDTPASALRIARKQQPGLILLNSNGQLQQTLQFLEQLEELAVQPPVVVMSSRASLEDAVAAMKRGAHDFWIKPVSAERLCKTIEWFEIKEATVPTNSAPGVPSIITENEGMVRLKLMARRVAASNASVFLQGESGTGKELFARYIHHHSDRREQPFIALNCAALPENLIESELFGHEKGAFTGAIKARQGKFELAHNGTLFLDEVTEIPIHLQSKLLRVLQEGQVDRVGGKLPVPVDVRVIASTNLAIEEALRSGQFRKDLYYRLNVIPLKIPPLKDRKEDITLLCRHFMEKYNQIHKRCVERITPEALKALEQHCWPGNVRELENVIQRAMLLNQERTLAPGHLIFDEESHHQTNEMDLMPIGEMERILIHKALAAHDGNRTRAAEILGISVRTLRNKLHQYETDQP